MLRDETHRGAQRPGYSRNERRVWSEQPRAPHDDADPEARAPGARKKRRQILSVARWRRCSFFGIPARYAEHPGSRSVEEGVLGEQMPDPERGGAQQQEFPPVRNQET